VGEGDWVWMMRGSASAVYCVVAAAIDRFIGLVLAITLEIQSVARNSTYLPTFNSPFPGSSSLSPAIEVTRGKCVWTWPELCVHMVRAVSGHGPCMSASSVFVRTGQQSSRIRVPLIRSRAISSF
jgi:hypothetical protein